MTAQFWLYFATALLMLAFVWGVVDVLGRGLILAWRRYQVRKEIRTLTPADAMKAVDAILHRSYDDARR